MTTFNQMNVSPATPDSAPTQADASQNKMLGNLLAQAELLPDPTPEELAEADRIFAEAFAPYVGRAEYLREQEMRKVELEEFILPHLIDLTQPAPIVKPIIEQRGMMIASLGNISAVVGAAKSKKTFLCTALVGGLLAENGDFGISPRLAKVLWVDTEQSQLHTRKVVERIHRLAGWTVERNSSLLRTLCLREVEPKQRAELLYMAIELYKPQLVIVDGISDLMYNTNDIEESDRIVGRLMALSTEHNCHILCVLHTNPNSDKARGHIGSTLQRKAETVIFVHKVGDCSVVEPQFCRNEEFEPFAFIIDEEGLPVECDLPKESSSQSNDCVRIMEDYYPNGIERTVLIDRLVSELGLTYGTAQVRISRALRSGLLTSNNGVIQCA
jgi:hypothetical protein